MSRFEVYTYTCEKHPLGTFVREVGAEEMYELEAARVLYLPCAHEVAWRDPR